jgi:hypothetical protein
VLLGKSTNTSRYGFEYDKAASGSGCGDKNKSRTASQAAFPIIFWRPASGGRALPRVPLGSAGFAVSPLRATIPSASFSNVPRNDATNPLVQS